MPVVGVVGAQAAGVGVEGGGVVRVRVRRHVGAAALRGCWVGAVEAARRRGVLTGVQIEVAGGGLVAGARVRRGACGGAAGDRVQGASAVGVVGPALVEGAGAARDVDRGALGVVVVVEERARGVLGRCRLAEGVVAVGLLDCPGAVVLGGQDRQRGVGVPLGAAGDGAVLGGGDLVAARVVVKGVGAAGDRGGGDLSGQVVGVDVGARLGLVAFAVVVVGGGRGAGGRRGELVGVVVAVTGGRGTQRGRQAVADFVVGVGGDTTGGAAGDPGLRGAA